MVQTWVELLGLRCMAYAGRAFAKLRAASPRLSAMAQAVGQAQCGQPGLQQVFRERYINTRRLLRGLAHAVNRVDYFDEDNSTSVLLFRVFMNTAIFAKCSLFPSVSRAIRLGLVSDWVTDSEPEELEEDY